MPFLGSTPPVNYKTLTKQTITGDSSTAYTLNEAVANANEIEVFVNNVRQNPSVDYTANNRTITFTDPLLSSDSCWLVYQGKAESTTIAQTSNIADGAVTAAKLDTTYAPTASPSFTGNVGIGTNSPSSTLHLANDSGTYLTIDSQTSASSNGNASISFYNDLGAKADIIMHRSGLTQDLVFRNNTSGEGILFRTNGNNDRMYINKSGDVQLLGGSGLYIGGTASANKLDDYEEGTWTATIRENSRSTSVNYTNQTCYYTKVGRLVTLNAYIAYSSHDGTASSLWRIYGFPFTPTNDYGAVFIYENSNAQLLGEMRLNVGSYGAFGSGTFPTGGGYLHFTATYALT